MEKNMYKFNKKFVWTMTIMLSVFMITFPSCAKEKPMSNVKTIQVVNFNLEGITHDDFMGVANEVAPNFATLPGLISKVWFSDKGNNTYGGVYSWKSQEDCENYRNGELYAGALTNNPNFVNLSDKGFDVLDGPSKITHIK